jgi:hypothetical protein
MCRVEKSIPLPLLTVGFHIVLQNLVNNWDGFFIDNVHPSQFCFSYLVVIKSKFNLKRCRSKNLAVSSMKKRKGRVPRDSESANSITAAKEEKGVNHSTLAGRPVTILVST